ncbi:MAG: hypothetical protein U0R65_02365 [Candidatus Nanopelagicales bacterium]|jgi:hypothetical protein
MQWHRSIRRMWTRWRTPVTAPPALVHTHEPSRQRLTRRHSARHAEQHPVRWAQGFDRPIG